MRYQRLLAIDPSLSCSGWALFSIRGKIPTACGVLSPPGPKISLAKRFDILQGLVDKLLTELNFGESDILVCEGPAPLVLNPQSALKVEGVRGIFETMSRQRGGLVPGRLNPRTIQIELLGMPGKQLQRKEVKIWAREIAFRLYGSELAKILQVRKQTISQDIIDAVLIGSLAVSRIERAARFGEELESAFLAKSKRREGSRSLDGVSSRSRVQHWSEADYRNHLLKSRS